MFIVSGLKVGGTCYVRTMNERFALWRPPGLPVRAVSPDESMALRSFFGPAFASSRKFDGSVARSLYGWAPRERDLAAELAHLASTI